MKKRKRDNVQQKAAKNYEKQQKAKTDIRDGKAKTGNKNQYEHRKAQKVQMETRL